MKKKFDSKLLHIDTINVHISIFVGSPKFMDTSCNRRLYIRGGKDSECGRCSV